MVKCQGYLIVTFGLMVTDVPMLAPNKRNKNTLKELKGNAE
jgi:hypothetical protein